MEFNPSVTSGNIHRSNVSTIFIVLLVLTTFICYFIYIFIPGPSVETASIPALLAALAGSHVGLSYYFYTDKKSYPVINEHKIRYFGVVPLIFMFNFIYFALADKGGEYYFHATMWIWNVWHFQKQHYGVYVFIKKYFGCRTDKFELNVIRFSGVSAMLMQVHFLAELLGTEEQKIFIGHYKGLLTNLAAIVLIFSVAAAVNFIRNDFVKGGNTKFGKNPLLIILLVFFACNYFPYFFLSPGAAMFVSHSGHGLQYVIFMLVIALQRNSREEENVKNGEESVRSYQKPVLINALLGVALVALIGYGLYKVSIHAGGWSLFGLSFGNAFASLAASITLGHFVHSRKYIQSYFSFLFPAKGDGQSKGIAV